MTIRKHLPIVPKSVLRRHHVHHPLDHRFRGCARLLQSLWRTQQGLAMGSYVTGSGTQRPLGSRLSDRAASNGSNFLTRDVAMLAWREAAYREPGAFIDERRLCGNLLSSMPLAFNLFGPLKLNLNLATKVVRALCPDLIDATVTAVLFEHSPGRGDPRLTGDQTAWDVFIAYSRPSGVIGFLGVEAKYSETVAAAQPALSPLHEKLAADAGLYRDTAGAASAHRRCDQFFREHLLAHATIRAGGRYSEGRFVVLAPALNEPVQRAIGTYARSLAPAGAKSVPFEHWTLEQFIERLRGCGEASYADALHARYLNWELVDQAMEAAFAVAGRPRKHANDNAAPNVVASGT